MNETIDQKLARALRFEHSTDLIRVFPNSEFDKRKDDNSSSSNNNSDAGLVVSNPFTNTMNELGIRVRTGTPIVR